MKHLIVLMACSVLFLACGAREEIDLPPAADLTPQAQDFVNKLSADDYAGCVATFDATMQNKLPEPELREAWNTIINQVGMFQKQLGVRQTREGGFDVVYVTCQFEKQKLDVKVVFNRDQKVTGLWFRPAK